MTIAVSYLRVSGESQIAGDGFPRQREICLKYATPNGIEIVEEFRDEGVTGKMELEGRAGLSACLQYVREHGIGLVIVESSDRLARDMIVAEVIIREFQKIGVKVISASGGVDLTEGNDANPTAKLIRQILAAVAEFDRCVIVLKLRGARDRQRAEFGKCEGRKGYGEHPDYPGEKEVVARMIVLRAEGNRPDQIAQILNSEGVETRGTKHGKSPWHPSTINKILARNKEKRLSCA
jgi:DNA invertase Pin-like site-specific DNA recombinase